MKIYLANLKKMMKEITIMNDWNMNLIKEKNIPKVEEITEEKKHMKKI